MIKTISFYTLGCRLNQAETAMLRERFQAHPIRIVDPENDIADLAVINTCTVTENSDSDTRKLINRILRRSPHTRIALVGCQAQLQPEQLASLPNVSFVLGNEIKMDLPDLLEQLNPDHPLILTPNISDSTFSEPVAGVDHEHTRANLKIQDGCNFFCAYCEVPYARGKPRSRTFDNVLDAARQLVQAGHRELVMTGINVGRYHHQGKTIVDVIDALESIEDLKRIRISSIEPTTIPEGLIERMAGGGKLCRYLHIPIQHGHDEILRTMNRRYSSETIAETIRDLANRIPDICLGTDVIVGFPGETETHFKHTYDLFRSLPLSYFHVFSYSDRNHNKSRHFTPKIPKETIDQRSKMMRTLSLQKRQHYFSRFIEQDVIVLFEQLKKGYWTGLTDTYIRVRVPSNQDLSNQIRPVHLQRIEHQTMVGSLK
jgi:threonylcarbamoyladenosine tRNA methylthiotransferase MtaB